MDSGLCPNDESVLVRVLLDEQTTLGVIGLVAGGNTSAREGEFWLHYRGLFRIAKKVFWIPEQPRLSENLLGT